MAKILLACHQFFPKHYTGTETLTLEVAEELRKRQHEVAVVTVEPLSITETAIVEKDTYNGVPVYRIVVPAPANSLEHLEFESADVRLKAVFLNIFQDFAPDIVHVFHLMRLTAEFVKIAKKRGIPVYFTATDFWLMCPTYQLLKHDGQLCTGADAQQCFACLADRYMQSQGSSLKGWLARTFPSVAGLLHPLSKKHQEILRNREQRHRLLMQTFDGVMWANQYASDMFHQNGLMAETEKIIPFPIPNLARSLIDLPFPSIDHGSLKVAFIGTFSHAKGPHIFLQACQQMSAEQDIEFYLWGGSGNSQYEAELKQMAEGLTKVHFCGIFPQQQFPQVLKDIHIVVIPSLWYENSPLTAISVLAAHRVLIVSDLGGLANLVENNVTGFTFPAGNANELSMIFSRLIKNRELTVKISEAVQPVNTIESYVDQVVSIYGI